ncbi:MAG: helix-turn-helix transcriptional regulator [Oscillospiraceae bacterium]|nr:helix-turn-helix transcriptional regulator [Oscillospiraceae bacterium]
MSITNPLLQIKERWIAKIGAIITARAHARTDGVDVGAHIRTGVGTDSVTGTGAVNLRRRLFIFLLILMITMLTGIILLLSAFGVFRFGAGETERLMHGELAYLSSGASKQFGGAYAQTIRLSERLSASIAEFMKRQGLYPAELKTHPDLLDPLLHELLPVIQNNLEVTNCSGVFMALDATVNPGIANAEHSKAGLYIRTVEPNVGGMGAEARYLLRGPSKFAGGGKLNLQAMWDLEFDVCDQPYWQNPIREHKEDPILPLSRLVYWCSTSPVQGFSEDVMICSVPILDRVGSTVITDAASGVGDVSGKNNASRENSANSESSASDIIGVCGFEISQMNFMLRHEPMTNVFHGAMFMFSSMNGGNISLADALYSGNPTLYGSFPKTGALIRASGGAGSGSNFTVYSAPGGTTFVGAGGELRLYPDGSPFAAQAFSTTLLIPKNEYDTLLSGYRLRFVLIFLALTAMGVAASVFLSKRYLKPITDKLATAGEAGTPEWTFIPEIDQLVEKIIAMHQPADPPRLRENLFEDFIARLETLTPTEREIFRHYTDGKTVSEIQSEMYISTSTVKTHSGHIYAKLGVASRDELVLYSELIKKSGMGDKIL